MGAMGTMTTTSTTLALEAVHGMNDAAARLTGAVLRDQIGSHEKMTAAGDLAVAIAKLGPDAITRAIKVLTCYAKSDTGRRWIGLNEDEAGT